jgi:hypothetical protein
MSVQERLQRMHVQHHFAAQNSTLTTKQSALYTWLVAAVACRCTPGLSGLMHLVSGLQARVRIVELTHERQSGVCCLLCELAVGLECSNTIVRVPKHHAVNPDVADMQHTNHACMCRTYNSSSAETVPSAGWGGFHRRIHGQTHMMPPLPTTTCFTCTQDVVSRAEKCCLFCSAVGGNSASTRVRPLMQSTLHHSKLC